MEWRGKQKEEKDENGRRGNVGMYKLNLFKNANLFSNFIFQKFKVNLQVIFYHYFVNFNLIVEFS